MITDAGVAQLVEHPTCNRTVEGSSPFSSNLMGVSHSGQLHRTVNPTASAYASSNLATPTLFIFRTLCLQEIPTSPTIISKKGR